MPLPKSEKTWQGAFPKNRFPKTESIEVKAYGDGTVFVAQATSGQNGDAFGLAGLYDAYGHALRDNADAPAYEIGERLAIARALRALGDKMEQRALGAVKHREDIKEHRKAAAATRRRRAAARRRTRKVVAIRPKTTARKKRATKAG